MTTEFHDRWEWTSASRGGSFLSGSQLQGVACHWPGTTTSAFGVESPSEVARRIRAWRNYHVSGRGWSDVGYNLAVSQDGGMWDLRGLRRVGAHSASASNSDANYEWLGVLFILGADEEPTGDMIEAFKRLRTEVILAEFPHATEITGHGRAPGVPGAQTSCPGPYVADLIRDGDLAGAPDENGDDMGYADWSQADRNAMIGDLKAALLDPSDLAAAADREGKLGRHVADNLRDIVLTGLADTTADKVIQHEFPKSVVENESLGVAVARLRRASISNTDALGTIVQILTANGVQLDPSVQAKVDQLLSDHEAILAELNGPVEVFPQDEEA